MKQWITVGSAFAILLALTVFKVNAADAQAVLGQSCALSGPTAFLGKEMHLGAKAYFDKHAPKIVLKVKDDGYEPSRCVENTTAFLAEPVDALFGYVGTPTSKAAVPIAREKSVVFFGAFTGAGFLSDHRINPHAFSVRAGYDTEIENMVRRLKSDLNVSSIGLFVQQDAFGLAGVSGAIKAVKAVDGVRIVPQPLPIPGEDAAQEEWKRFWSSVPNYHRNTVQVGRAARLVSGTRVDAVIMVGAYRPCAMAINLWKRLEFDAVFLNISFVGSQALAEYLGGDVQNVFVSQVTPDPWDARIPLVREYQAAMGRGQYGFVSLEGYMAAKTFHQALGKIGGTLDFISLKTALEALGNFDLGGVSLSFGPSDHRGSDAVYLTAIEAAAAGGGKYDYKFNYIDAIVKE